MHYVETTMADLIQFEDWLSKSPHKAAGPQQTPADILLFTGVRYERLETHDEPPTTKHSGTARKRRG